jgi:hypothetical protein
MFDINLNGGHPRYGNIPITGGVGSGTVRTPGPGRATNPNQKAAHQLQGALMSWGFNAGEIAGVLVSMEAGLQKRLAEVVFAIVGHWAEMATVGSDTTNPMYEEYQAANRMLRNLFPGSTPPTIG